MSTCPCHRHRSLAKPVVPVLTLMLGLFLAGFASAAPTTAPASQPSTTPATGLSGLLGGLMPPTPAAPSTRPATLPATAMDQKPIHRGDRASRPATTQPSAMAQTKAPSTDYDITRVALSLAVVIGLIFVAKWVSKRFFAWPTGGSSGVMQVVSRTPLAPKQQILLVRIGRRMMVIGDSGGRLTSLGQIDDPDEVASLLSQSQSAAEKRPVAMPFGSIFKRLGATRRQESTESEWSELEADASAGDERASLFGRERPTDTAAKTSRADEDDVDARSIDATPSDPAEAAAKAAVESARQDIQALRDKLRSMTGRIGGSNESPA